MRMMVAFCFEDYGEKTASPYCSYAELKYFLDNMKHVTLLPLKLYDIGDFSAWPPKPAHRDDVYDGHPENDGAAQNKYAITGDMVVREFDPRSAGAAVACAKYIAEEYAKLPAPKRVLAPVADLGVISSVRKEWATRNGADA